MVKLGRVARIFSCAWVLAVVATLGPPGETLSAFEGLSSRVSRIDIGRAGSAQLGPAVQKPIKNYTVHVPARLDPDKPAQVMFVLHGMNGNGQDMIAPFIEYAEKYGWVVVAPTIDYRDWKDPEQVRLDGIDHMPALKQLIEQLPTQLGRQLSPQVVLLGFSRGAQTAQRFAFFYPELVRAVVSSSAGTYTLPVAALRSEQGEQALPFPFGMGGMEPYTGRQFVPEAVRSVSFFVSVGATDNRAADVPRQWDGYIGATRVERAETFVRSLRALDIKAELRVVPGVDHEMTPAVRTQACEFLRAIVSA